MNRKRKLVKPACFPKNTKIANSLNVSKMDVRESERTLVSIGLRRNEWKQSNDDRQWW
jgi:hypothetical protein